MEPEATAPPPGAPPPEAPSPAAAPPPAVPVSNLRLYLLAVATLGIYVAIWAYRMGRRFDPEGRRSKHRAWASAIMCPPLFSVVLYELGRLINHEGQRAVRTFGGGAVVPAAVYAGLAAALTLSSLDTLWSPLWLVLPVPVLLVNSRANLLDQLQRDMASPPAMPRPRQPRWQIAVMALGVPASLALAFWLDRHDYQGLFRSALGEGLAVQADAGSFELRTPDREWYRLPSRTLGDDGAQLELARSDQSSWLIAYVSRLPDDSLDSVVRGRREIISAEASIRSFNEKRTFLAVEDLIPQSMAEYRVGATSLQSGYVVLTVKRDATIFELVGWTGAWQRDVEALRKLMGSFRLRKSPTR